MSRCRLIALALSLAFPSIGLAHGLDATCKFRDGNIIVEAYFDTDEPAADALVVVENADGNVIGQGRTDSNGEWRFAHPGAGQYRVVVDTIDKHRAVKKLNLTASGLADDELVRSERSSRSREHFTGYRMLKLAVGLAAIGLFVLALRLAVRRRAVPAAAGPYNERETGNSPQGGPEQT